MGARVALKAEGAAVEALEAALEAVAMEVARVEVVEAYEAEWAAETEGGEGVKEHRHVPRAQRHRCGLGWGIAYLWAVPCFIAPTAVRSLSEYDYD